MKVYNYKIIEINDLEKTTEVIAKIKDWNHAILILYALRDANNNEKIKYKLES